MNSQLFLSILLFTFIQKSYSAGFLKLELTADSDCLVNLESTFYTGTVRLLSYETRSLQLYSQGPLTEMGVSLQLLHHFSGNPISKDYYNEFSLRNSGKWEARVIDSAGVILSIRATFVCEEGFFGPLCERKSRLIPYPTTSATPSTSSPFPFPSFDFQVSKDTACYVFFVLLVLLLVIGNTCLFCCRRSEIHTYQDTTLPVELPKVFCIDEHSGYLSDAGASFGSTRYTGAPNRFISSVTLQSVV